MAVPDGQEPNQDAIRAIRAIRARVAVPCHFSSKGVHLTEEERDALLAALAQLQAALIDCAEAAGVDGEAVEAARSGAMKHPSIEQFAVEAVRELRKDYDDDTEAAQLRAERNALRQVVLDHWPPSQAEQILAAALAPAPAPRSKDDLHRQGLDSEPFPLAPAPEAETT